MSTDPRRFEQTEETLERRLEEIFRNLAAPKSVRPTDAASSLVFVQELWDRLSPMKAK